MALIHCPECNKEISNAAVACPNCGYPLVKLKEEVVKEVKSVQEEPVAPADSSESSADEMPFVKVVNFLKPSPFSTAVGLIGASIIIAVGIPLIPFGIGVIMIIFGIISFFFGAGSSEYLYGDCPYCGTRIKLKKAVGAFICPDCKNVGNQTVNTLESTHYYEHQVPADSDSVSSEQAAISETEPQKVAGSGTDKNIKIAFICLLVSLGIAGIAISAYMSNKSAYSSASSSKTISSVDYDMLKAIDNAAASAMDGYDFEAYVFDIDQNGCVEFSGSLNCGLTVSRYSFGYMVDTVCKAIKRAAEENGLEFDSIKFSATGTEGVMTWDAESFESGNLLDLTNGYSVVDEEMSYEKLYEHCGYKPA